MLSAVLHQAGARIGKQVFWHMIALTRARMFPVLMLLCLLAGQAQAQTQAPPLAQDVSDAPPPDPDLLATRCAHLAPVTDACELVRVAAQMLRPSYAQDKGSEGITQFKELGYEAEYFPARAFRLFSGTTNVFLAAKPRSDRLFVIITGSETERDWIENLNAAPAPADWRRGGYYIPPGHSGFRSGADEIVYTLLRSGEFEQHGFDCNPDRLNRRTTSPVSRFVCANEVMSGESETIDVVLVGHSRGAAIANLAAPAFAGHTILSVADGTVDVRPQRHWPLRLHAIIGFAPPPALYAFTDDAVGADSPSGAPDQEEVYQRAGIPERAIMFLNESDVVPLLSMGTMRQLGRHFRVRSDGQVEYVSHDWSQTIDLARDHSAGGYCRDVLAALQTGDNIIDQSCLARPASDRAMAD
ncbi:MAG: lipase family protein [Sphingomonadaceae bacterium]